MDSQDIRGLLKEVFQHIEQRIDSGEDYSVLETAIKGNEEMMHSSVIASLLDTRGSHGCLQTKHGRSTLGLLTAGTLC